MSEWKTPDNTKKKPENEITKKLDEAEAHLLIKINELMKQRDMWLQLLKQKSEDK